LIVQRLLRPQDKLHLFELHSTDVPLLERNVQHLHAGRQVQVHASDGFAATKALLPPPSRRGLVLLDPSYEIKTDYARTAAAVADGLERFATGTFAVWVPQLARLDAQHLPDKLKRMAERAGRPWLHAALAVRAPGGVHSGLHASSMLVINPPYTLRATLRRALMQLHELLAQDTHASYAISSQ
ncbi:MAG: 23S rRNA (adenine(2030)-N(6))-methyltransferase RlmJ, partial [Betaproteobacteria bacterium]|nr:23S rRNA (adenine(2030)-N(6))-methyltransferase RlmJ [Betaproteobacteria bacterium]